MKLTRVFPGFPETVDLDAEGARDILEEWYRPPRADWFRLNLVGSVSGSATGSDGTSETLTNPADRVVLGVMRMLADVVLVGAETVRAEGYFVPRKAALAVVTRSGDLTGHRITSTGQRGQLLVLAPASAAAAARDTVADDGARVIVVPDTDGLLAASDIRSALADAGLRSIVCEGGPLLASRLLTAGVVDELCLTTSPVLNGAPVALFGGNEFPPHELRLAQLVVDSGNGLYARWLITTD